MNAITLFIICTAVNVVISTIKSIVTVNGSKLSAAFWNAAGYGFYAYVVVLTASGDLETWQKVAITAGCNFIGVYIVKLVEQKMRKDKLWEVRLTVEKDKGPALHRLLTGRDIPHNYTETEPWWVFNCYAETQAETMAIIESGKRHNAKMFASETKLI